MRENKLISFLRMNRIGISLLMMSVASILVVILVLLINHFYHHYYLSIGQVSIEILIAHYCIVFFCILLSFLVFDMLFRYISWRKQNQHSYLLIRTTLQTLTVAAITYLHIGVLYWLDLTHHDLIHANTIKFLIGESFIIIFFAFIVAFSLNFMLFLIRFVGLDLFWNIVSNQYNKPRPHDTVIMYLDLNDSTPLNAQLGNERYLKFREDFFVDAGKAIYLTCGDVSQYQGDEILITWPSKLAFKNNNSVNLFFLAQTFIESRRAHYLQEYGVIPTFKASLHCGELTFSVAGYNKISVHFTGTTLNEGARIIGECHALQHNFLTSEAFVKRLLPDSSYTVERLGSYALKGVQDKMLIYAIESTA